MIVAIEVGGTFTDLVLRDGSYSITHKVPSTPEDPATGALQGLDGLLSLSGRRSSDIDTLLHGSTIAANALIQRRGARTGFITTRGFRDILFTQRADRTAIYDMFYRKPVPLVPRDRCAEVKERQAADGSVVTELDQADARAVLARLVEDEKVESIAICLLHAYASSQHEDEFAALASRLYPELYVTTSAAISPEHREYERASTTVIAAYLRPILDRYLSIFAEGLSKRGFAGRPLIMLSNGGVVPLPVARNMPASMFLSGPAAGATGAAVLARASGALNLISIDVGGTSSDVCLINDGATQTTVKGTAEFGIDGLPLNLMMTDVVAIGAGGGSIASVDPGGMLHVGPQSAGAKPGPACYGRGGTEFTLSDAMLLLGLLDSRRPLPGGIQLDVKKANAAALPISARLGLSPLALAERVYRIATANMAQAVRRVSVKRGYDPRQYALSSGGGVGALVACALADEIGIARVLVPQHPGIYSAFGLSVADLRMDYQRAKAAVACSTISADDLDSWLEDLARTAERDYVELGYDAGHLEFEFSFDGRYVGQGYELRVAIDRSPGSRADGATLAERFHRSHAGQYGHAFLHQDVEILSFRLSAFKRREQNLLDYRSAEPIVCADTREITWQDRSLTCSVHDRAALVPGQRVAGPCFIVEQTSSTLVLPDWNATVTDAGLLSVSKGSRA